MNIARHLLFLIAFSVAGSCASSPAAIPEHEEHKNVQAPKVVQRFEPIYTDELRHDGVGGVVEVAGTVPKEGGTLRNAHVVKSDNPRLNQIAVDAVSRWIWSPGFQDGKAVDVEFRTKVAFSVRHLH